MMTAATTRIVQRKKSATRATSAFCLRHGIFIELIGDVNPINSEVGEGCDQMTGGVQADVQVPGRVGNKPGDHGSAMPGRVADPSACVWPVKCGVVFLDVVEIDGAERRVRLL